jgi:hypothetical protein
MDFYILLAKFSFALLLLCAEMKVFLQFEILFRGQHVGCWVRGDPHRQPTPRKRFHFDLDRLFEGKSDNRAKRGWKNLHNYTQFDLFRFSHPPT